MYSEQLHHYLGNVADECGLQADQVSFLDDTMSCYLSVLAHMLGAKVVFSSDLLQVSVQLLLLDDGFAPYPVDDPRAEAAHYLIGLGLEQTGTLLARLRRHHWDGVHPLESDCWYRMVLATLHYLAGGHRVQARNSLRYIERVADSAEARGQAGASEYSSAARSLKALYAGAPPGAQADYWHSLFDGRLEPSRATEERIVRLVTTTQQRRDIMLQDLGRGREVEWVAARGLRDGEAAAFWRMYLEQLDRRGINTFTPEQVGPGFAEWLQPEQDLLVVLPTGAGKTIIGELRTALSLAEGKQVIWLLPTRALVRQTKRELRDAFSPMGREVAELPVSEDALPQFLDAFDSQTAIAVTTPERMAALLRGNPDAVARVDLVVLDEAHILLKETRAQAAEMVLRTMVDIAPEAALVLMTAYSQAEEPLTAMLDVLARPPLVLTSKRRPTRQMCGVIAKEPDEGNGHPAVLIYPPRVYDGHGRAPRSYRLEFESVTLTSRGGSTELAARVARQCTSAPLKSVLFVQRKDSTERQAQVVAGAGALRELPDTDVARLRVELGTESGIERTARRGAAPHHGALSRLEQHTVEKWLRTDLLSTVVATSTLAEGINLPFDLSILAYTTRYDEQTESRRPLTQEEMLNMLGRAGRAGHVADGICLIADRGPNPRQVYEQHHRVFFEPVSPSTEPLGVAALLLAALGAHVGEAGWIDSMSGLSFAQAQTLLSSVASASGDAEDPSRALYAYFERFPSTHLLTADDFRGAIAELSQLSVGLREQTRDDPVLLELLKTTGLPITALRLLWGQFVSSQHELPDLDVFQWAADVIAGVLAECRECAWYESLLGRPLGREGLEPQTVLDAILAWAQGAPLVSVIDRFGIDGNEAKRRRTAVDFLNHNLSLLSQFWGALAVCAWQPEVGCGEATALQLQRLPALVREGAMSLPELVWLREMGSLDRVLAHRLAEHGQTYGNYREQRRYVGAQLRQYHYDPAAIPEELTDTERSALRGVVQELFEAD